MMTIIVDPLIPSPYELKCPLYLVPEPLNMTQKVLEKVGYDGFFMRMVNNSHEIPFVPIFFLSIGITLKECGVILRGHLSLHGIDTRGRTIINPHHNLQEENKP